MSCTQRVLAVCILTMAGTLVTGIAAHAADEPADKSQIPAPVVQEVRTPLPSTSGPTTVANLDTRLGVLEEWKAKIERLPSLSDKFNIGMNAIQFLYAHQDAHVAEGKSQDNFSIRRSEILIYGKVNEYIPKWHTLLEMQSNNLTNSTPGCAVGANCSTAASGTRVRQPCFVKPISMSGRYPASHPISTSFEWAYSVCPSVFSQNNPAVSAM